MQFTPWNPNPRAIQRVNDPYPIPTHCRYCGRHVMIEHHLNVFKRIHDSRWPWLYHCWTCGARVSIHPGTDIPMGSLADKKTRRARASAHRYFDDVVRNRNLERTEAYQWLASQLEISPSQCHFGWFDTDMCERAANICREFK
ncbi:zinc-finger-containing protein [Xenorhabdus taiwanensis]|uniref:zinc-finger-containing protein n=1 Tax=Xenorhabdus taiwanensis TaxID=3085177 RepID=UPI0035A600D5